MEGTVVRARGSRGQHRAIRVLGGEKIAVSTLVLVFPEPRHEPFETRSRTRRGGCRRDLRIHRDRRGRHSRQRFAAFRTRNRSVSRMDERVLKQIRGSRGRNRLGRLEIHRERRNFFSGRQGFAFERSSELLEPLSKFQCPWRVRPRPRVRTIGRGGWPQRDSINAHGCGQ